MCIRDRVLSNMLVGFTDKIPEFFQRLEVYWNISSSSRDRARNGAMKQTINVQKRNNTNTYLSSQAEIILQASLSHDIELYNYARNTIWDRQSIFSF